MHLKGSESKSASVRLTRSSMFSRDLMMVIDCPCLCSRQPRTRGIARAQHLPTRPRLLVVEGSASGRATCPWRKSRGGLPQRCSSKALRRAANGHKPATKRQIRMCTNPSHESSSDRSEGKNVQYIWCRDCFSEAQDINNLEQAQLKHLSDSCFAKPSFALTYWGSRNKRAFVVAQAEQKGERVDTLHVFPCVSSLSFLL